MKMEDEDYDNNLKPDFWVVVHAKLHALHVSCHFFSSDLIFPCLPPLLSVTAVLNKKCRNVWSHSG